MTGASHPVMISLAALARWQAWQSTGSRNSL